MPATVPIDRPIFLVGLQGGGLTLLARMLRRNRVVVSVTGNHTYWAGPDEVQNVMGAILPPSLAGLHHQVPPHSRFPRRDWLYATDELLPFYRRTADDANEEMRLRLRYAIGLAQWLSADDPASARFLDKSQTYTVRMALVQALLREQAPHFLLVTRNPYALCLRAATRSRNLLALGIPLRRRLELASQHWTNSIACALEDADQLPHFHTIRFEDLLSEPRETLEEICHFLQLTFCDDMLPQPDDSLPLGSTGSSRGDRKWYPLRPDVNRPYLEQLNAGMAVLLQRRVGRLARRFNYSPDGSH